jgi:hypothetical protein
MRAMGLKRPAPVLVKGSLNGWKERELGELLVLAAGGPGGFEAEVVTILKPGGNLLDGGLFEVVRQGGLAGGRCGAGESVAVGAGDPRKGGLKVERGLRAGRA